MALVLITRSQKTKVGHLRAGRAVDFNESDPDQKKVLDRLLDKKFAKKTTKKALDKAKIEAESIAATSIEKGDNLAPVVADLEAKLDLIAKAAGATVDARALVDDAIKAIDGEADEAKAKKLQAKAKNLADAYDATIAALIEVAHA